MSALHEMNNVQKAKLICQLLPADIPGFLDFAKALSNSITADPDGLRKQWTENPIIGPQHWIAYATETIRVIDECGNKLARSPKIFSDQLFDGMLAPYTVHCLQQYAKQKTASEKFKLAADLIFSSRI